MKLISNEITTIQNLTYSLDKGLKLLVVKTNDTITKQTLMLGDRTMSIVKDEFLDVIKKINVFLDEVEDIDDYFITDYITYFQNNDVKYDNILEVKYYDYTIRTFNDTIISMPLKLINYEITNVRYDLEEVLKYLKGHNYILNVDTLDIEDIPYYNQDGVYGCRTECIEPTILLPQSVFDTITKKLKEVNDHHSPSSYCDYIAGRKMSKLDVLGLSQFLKPIRNENI